MRLLTFFIESLLLIISMLFRRLERWFYKLRFRLFRLMLDNFLRHWFVINWWRLLWLLNYNRRWWQWWLAWNTYWVAMMNNLMINIFINLIFKCWNRFTFLFFLRLRIFLISSHRWSERLPSRIFLIVFDLTFLLLIGILRNLFPIKRNNFHLSILKFICAAFIIRLNNINDIIESMSQLESTFLGVNMG